MRSTATTPGKLRSAVLVDVGTATLWLDRGRPSLVRRSDPISVSPCASSGGHRTASPASRAVASGVLCVSKGLGLAVQPELAAESGARTLHSSRRQWWRRCAGWQSWS
jgi:hypothetical protein